MNIPWSVGNRLQSQDWESVRMQLMFDCCKWDIQSEDHSVVADFPLLLEDSEWTVVSGLAEKLAQETIAAERELLCRPDLHAKLGLPKSIRKALRKCSPENIPSGAARVMRFDFHPTPEGWRISEVNADVPGGFIEASGFSELMASHYLSCTIPPNPVSAYIEAIANAVGEAAPIGLVHATAHCDDRQVMEYLARKLQQKGMQAVAAGPNHLKWQAGFARITSSFASLKPGLLIRFFPAEWLPNLRSPSMWQSWFCGGKTLMSNPGSAILIQSKRFPLAWSELKTALPTWQSLLPETKCPSEVTIDSSDWVVKPVFGRVGEDIGIGGVIEQHSHKAIIKEAKRHPANWVAQRRFATLPIETHDGIRYGCLGLFTLDGHAIGAYGRIATKPLIDHDAQDIAILVHRKDLAN